mmetsp:Transcript_9135/g.22389  ORF Transcript_9135/g.22389 Transcript_9135/m.22389 type:complete len:439 (+) Transcript_9135:1949-3265(+)
MGRALMFFFDVVRVVLVDETLEVQRWRDFHGLVLADHVQNVLAGGRPRQLLIQIQRRGGPVASTLDRRGGAARPQAAVAVLRLSARILLLLLLALLAGRHQLGQQTRLVILFFRTAADLFLLLLVLLLVLELILAGVTRLLRNAYGLLQKFCVVKLLLAGLQCLRLLRDTDVRAVLGSGLEGGGLFCHAGVSSARRDPDLAHDLHRREHPTVLEHDRFALAFRMFLRYELPAEIIFSSASVADAAATDGRCRARTGAAFFVFTAGCRIRHRFRFDVLGHGSGQLAGDRVIGDDGLFILARNQLLPAAQKRYARRRRRAFPVNRRGLRLGFAQHVRLLSRRTPFIRQLRRSCSRSRSTRGPPDVRFQRPHRLDLVRICHDGFRSTRSCPQDLLSSSRSCFLLRLRGGGRLLRLQRVRVGKKRHVPMVHLAELLHPVRIL